jgi:hypothetical protein
VLASARVPIDTACRRAEIGVSNVAAPFSTASSATATGFGIISTAPPKLTAPTKINPPFTLRPISPLHSAGSTAAGV